MSEEKGRLFGTDGVRGMANRYPMTAEMALCLGQAIAHVFHSARGEHKRIIIGKDTRLSGYLFGARHLHKPPNGSFCKAVCARSASYGFERRKNRFDLRADIAGFFVVGN